jgi:cyclophilin family peptidyl-prolyl cis-trans isomerase
MTERQGVATSQHSLTFYFDPVDNSFLDWFDRSSDSAHPVFGRIIENYDLVVKISQVPTRNDNPVEPIRVTNIRVE